MTGGGRRGLRVPPGRYPRRRTPSPPVGVALVAAALIAGAGALYVVATDRYAKGVRAEVVSFDVRSAAEVVVRFTVDKPAGRPARCVVRARDRTGAEVGAEVVVIPARSDGRRRTTESHRLATSARSVTGEVPTCRLG